MVGSIIQAPDSVILQRGTATNITSGSPFQLRGIAGQGFLSHTLILKNVLTTAGIASFGIDCRLFDGTVIDSGVSDYATQPVGATKSAQINLMTGISNDVVGSFKAEINLELSNFLDASKPSRVMSYAFGFFDVSLNTALSQIYSHARNANKVHNGLDIYPTVNTITFEWILIGNSKR